MYIIEREFGVRCLRLLQHLYLVMPTYAGNAEYTATLVYADWKYLGADAVFLHYELYAGSISPATCPHHQSFSRSETHGCVYALFRQEWL